MKSRRRILVADDNPLIRKTLCDLFKEHESLEICDEAVDGLQAATTICKLLPNVPIILLTMYAHVIRQTETEVAGINRWFRRMNQTQ